MNSPERAFAFSSGPTLIAGPFQWGIYLHNSKFENAKIAFAKFMGYMQPGQRAIQPFFQRIGAMYRLTEAFPYLITRVGVRMGELFSRRLESYGLTLPMYRVLAALWQRGGQHLGGLSEMTSVEVSTLSRLVGAMQRGGLLSRTRPDSDGRTVEINLTRAGRALVAQLIPFAERYEELVLRGFAIDEVEIFKKNLAAVYRNLDVLEREVAETESTTARKRSAAARSSSSKQIKLPEDEKDRLRPAR